jgi:hypothetical protein
MIPQSVGLRPGTHNSPQADHTPEPGGSAPPLSDEDRQMPEETPRDKRRAALAYARRGRPIFPCKEGGKEPLTRHGFKDATTDEEQIRQWWKKYPDANIASPTGEVSDTLAVDHDLYKPEAINLKELETKLGPASRTGVAIETGSGGRQYLFRFPKGSNIRNTTGLLSGVDIRGEGGYILLPPSTTQGAYRRLDNRTLTDPPAPLVERLTEPNRTRSRGTGGTTAPITANLDGPPILKGERDHSLTRIAGKLHDGTRGLDDLTYDLMEINASRCAPPLTDREVCRIARSIHGRRPCRPGKPREVDGLIEELSDFWHSQKWKKIAGKSEARFARALIREGRKVGTPAGGGLRVERSRRQMAEILGCHQNTVTNIAKRAEKNGWLRRDPDRRSEWKSGAFILIPPRQVCAISIHRGGVGPHTDGRGGSTSLSRPEEKPANVANLTTEHYRHRGHVGYSREHTLCTFEARGPMTRERAAALLGWSRARDLERLHLEPLCELGLLEKHGDRYSIPAEYAERQQSVRGEAFSTVQERVSRERSVEGRSVYVIRESGMVASEAERAELQKEKHRIERELFRNRGKEQSTPTEVSEASREAIRRNHGAREAGLAEMQRRAAEAKKTAEQRRKEGRVRRLVREGMARRFAEQAVYGCGTRSDAPSGPPDEAGARKKPRMVEGVYVHGPLCDCWMCDESSEAGEGGTAPGKAYATTRRGAA